MTVAGDVSFGRNVVLRGTVIMCALPPFEPAAGPQLTFRVLAAASRTTARGSSCRTARRSRTSSFRVTSPSPTASLLLYLPPSYFRIELTADVPLFFCRLSGRRMRIHITFSLLAQERAEDASLAGRQQKTLSRDLPLLTLSPFSGVQSPRLLPPLQTSPLPFLPFWLSPPRASTVVSLSVPRNQVHRTPS